MRAGTIRADKLLVLASRFYLPEKEFVEKNNKEGLSFVELNSGRFKDSGSPSKKLLPIERQIFQKQLNDLHQLMIEDIAKKRKIDKEKLVKLADGSSLTGVEALSVGLIDKNGSLFDAIDWIEKKFGRADLCPVEYE